MTAYQYLGGLPIGAAEDEVDVRILGSVLRVEHQPGILHHRHGGRQPWSVDLPLADLSRVEVSQTSSGRAAHPTARARSQDGYLTIDARTSGATTIVHRGRQPELERLCQTILQAQTQATEEREW
jgi:hypothetical protein